MALRHGAQRAPGPQGGGGGGGRLEPVGEADLPGEGHRLGAARQQGLGAEVDPRARDLARQQLAADPVRGLQDGDPGASFQQSVRGGQPRDPGSDDDDMSGSRT